MLRNLFKKKGKETHSSSGLSEQVDKSILPMITHQLYMHYFDKNSPVEHENPAWRNQGIFFWKANEPFEKKSLPPEFKEYEERFFIINENPIDFRLNTGKAAPWFGMPGNGDKHYIAEEEKEIPIETLSAQKVLEYVELVELNDDNTSILSDRTNYRLVLDMETMKYSPSSDKFFFNGKDVTLGRAYELGGIRFVKTNPSGGN